MSYSPEQLQAFNALLNTVEERFDDELRTEDQRGNLPTFGYKLNELVLIVGMGPNIQSFFAPEDHDKLSLSILDFPKQTALFAALEADRQKLDDDIRLYLHDLYVAFLHELDERGYRFAFVHPNNPALPPTIMATHTDRDPSLLMLFCEHRPDAVVGYNPSPHKVSV